MSKSKARSNLIWSIVMTIVCVIYMYPIFMVLMNSLKVESAISTSTAFQLPNSETFAGLDNYVNAITSRGFFASFGYTLFITVSSVAAILLFCSMFAWYITRVRSWVTKALYLLCAFSMVVPFQMVMFTLSSLADSMRINFFGLYTLRFNTPWMLWFVYLGFGAGLAVFMFRGFMRSVPLEIEEASMIDGCNPLQTYFKAVSYTHLYDVGTALETAFLFFDRDAGPVAHALVGTRQVVEHRRLAAVRVAGKRNFHTHAFSPLSCG